MYGTTCRRQPSSERPAHAQRPAGTQCGSPPDGPGRRYERIPPTSQTAAPTPLPSTGISELHPLLSLVVWAAPAEITSVQPMLHRLLRGAFNELASAQVPAVRLPSGRRPPGRGPRRAPLRAAVAVAATFSSTRPGPRCAYSPGGRRRFQGPYPPSPARQTIRSTGCLARTDWLAQPSDSGPRSVPLHLCRPARRQSRVRHRGGSQSSIWSKVSTAERKVSCSDTAALMRTTKSERAVSDGVPSALMLPGSSSHAIKWITAE